VVSPSAGVAPPAASRRFLSKLPTTYPLPTVQCGEAGGARPISVSPPGPSGCWGACQGRGGSCEPLTTACSSRILAHLRPLLTAAPCRSGGEPARPDPETWEDARGVVGRGSLGPINAMWHSARGEIGMGKKRGTSNLTAFVCHEEPDGLHLWKCPWETTWSPGGNEPTD
jgi:hypothetical protein